MTEVNTPLIRKRRPTDLGTWIWLLNRIAGVTITAYLILHIFIIGGTRSGAASFDGIMSALHNPLALFLEFVLIMAVLAHGLNGLRHICIDFGLFAPGKHVSLLVGAGAMGVLVFFISVALLLA